MASLLAPASRIGWRIFGTGNLTHERYHARTRYAQANRLRSDAHVGLLPWNGGGGIGVALRKRTLSLVKGLLMKDPFRSRVASRPGTSAALPLIRIHPKQFRFENPCPAPGQGRSSAPTVPCFQQRFPARPPAPMTSQPSNAPARNRACAIPGTPCCTKVFDVDFVIGESGQALLRIAQPARGMPLAAPVYIATANLRDRASPAL